MVVGDGNRRAHSSHSTRAPFNQRLTELRQTGIVALHDSGGYTVTADGLSLLRSLAPLDDWAKRWGEREQGPRR